MTGALKWRVAKIGLVAFVILVLLFLVVPTMIIVPLSFSGEEFMKFPPRSFSSKWYEAFFGSRDFMTSVLNSLKIGIPAASLATLNGTLAALALARGKLPFRRALSALIIAPLILPQIVLALGLFPVMARIGLIGSYLGIVLAHAVVTMPLAFITVSTSLSNYPESLETAAQTLGANGWRTFAHVTYPLIRPGIILGFIFSFAFSFDELILSIFLTSPATRTVPRMLWEQLNYEVTPIIAAATCCILTGTLVLLSAGALVQRRSRIAIKVEAT